jgi:hypothetical protein
VDDFQHDLLTALGNGPGASSAELLEQLLAGEPRPGVTYSVGWIETTLFDFEREGLVTQDESDMAESPGPGQPAPAARRYWLITEAGEQRLRAD